MREGRLRPLWRFIIFLLVVPIPALYASGAWGSKWFGAIVALAGSLFLVPVLDGRPLGRIGLPLSGVAARDFALGVTISTVQLLSIFALELGNGWVRVLAAHTPPVSIERFADVGYWLGDALLEELLSRGYGFQCLLLMGGCRYGPALALGLTSAFFSFMLLGNLHASDLSTAAMLVAGAEYGIAYLVTRRLWLPIAMHFSWNLILGSFLGYPVSGGSHPSLLPLERAGPADWTGGAFGPEAGCPAIGLALLNITFMLLTSRLGPWRPERWPELGEIKAASDANRRC